VTAREAVRLIRAGDTVAIGGFGGIGIVRRSFHELGEIYKASDSELANFGKPGDLTLFFWRRQGNPSTGAASIALRNRASSARDRRAFPISSRQSSG